MSATLISFLICVPFLLVALIAGFIFLRSGFKKGPWRALFSVGVTLLATVVSLLLSKLLAGLLAPVILNLLPMDQIAPSKALLPLVTNLAQGLVQAVLALLVFSLVLFVALIVLKCVGNRLKGGFFAKLDDWNPEKKGLKWAGLGIRTLDALLVTLLLLIPVYGTLASVVSPVSQILQLTQSAKPQQSPGPMARDLEPVNQDGAEYNNDMAPQEPSDTLTMEAVLALVADHPLVTVYKAGPTSWVMNELSNVGINGTSVSLTGVTQTVDGMMTRVDRLMAAIETQNPQRITDALEDLGRYTRDNLVNQDFLYDLLMGYKDELDTLIDQNAEAIGPEAMVEIEQLMELLDMSREDFQDNANALLDFGLFFLDKYGPNIINNQEPTEEEFEPVYEQLGKLVNGSKQLIYLRNYALGMYSRELFYDAYDLDYYRDYTDAESIKQAKLVQEKLEAFVAKFPTQATDPKDHTAEGKALFELFRGGSVESQMVNFGNLPYVDKEDLVFLINSSMLNDDYYYEQAPQVDPALIESLKESFLSEKNEGFFYNVELCQQIVAFSQNRENAQGFSLTLSRAGLDFLLNELGKDYLQNTFDLGAQSVRMLEEIARYLESHPEIPDGETLKLNSLEQLFGLEAGKWPTQVPEVSEEEKEEISSYFPYGDTAVIGGGGNDPYGRLNLACSVICRSGVTIKTMEHLVATQGKDPWGLGKSLTPAQKQTFAQLLDDLKKALFVDPDKIPGNSQLPSGVQGGSANIGDLIHSGSASGGSGSHGTIVIRPDGDSSGEGALNGSLLLGSGSGNASSGGLVVGGTGLSGGTVVDSFTILLSPEAVEAYNQQVAAGVKALADFFGV